MNIIALDNYGFRNIFYQGPIEQTIRNTIPAPESGLILKKKKKKYDKEFNQIIIQQKCL